MKLNNVLFVGLYSILQLVSGKPHQPKLEKMALAASGSPFEVKNLTLASGPSIFYRTAGAPNKPVILLLHGFPSSSFQYRNLIALLSESHHVIAPDFPGFGFTVVPDKYSYTFDGLTKSTVEFLDALKIKKFAVYIFDYGAPVAFRLALERPEAITAIISQNGNAYEEGLGDFWNPIRELWKEDTPERRDVLAKALLSFETTKFQYEHGVADPAQIPPETYNLDYALLQRPGQTGIQIGFFKDYRTNVELYPKFQEYLRSSKVPVLAVWGANDVIFEKGGAEAYARDVKDLELILLPTGHFALETHGKEIAHKILEFLSERRL